MSATEHAEKVKKRQISEHRKMLKARALKKSWEKIKKEKAVKELKNFVDMEIKRYRLVAEDGVALEADGETVIRFTNEQRISYLDKASGLEEVAYYLERH